MEDQEFLTTAILARQPLGKEYVYVLADTNFYVEGGGQLADVGTLNGYPVKRVYEEDGQIYHQVAKKIEGSEASLWVDLNHRYISRQGHTAQHLLSAALRKLYGIETISHHYDLNGSSIDLNVPLIDEKMLQEAEDWCNARISEDHVVRSFYPDAKTLSQLTLAHQPPADKPVRIVEIEGVEWNPCKGMHVSHLSELGMLVVCSTEKVRGHVRVHYMSGEVLRRQFHAGFKTLHRASLQLSKPPLEVAEGIESLLESKLVLERELRQQEKTQAVQLGKWLWEQAQMRENGRCISAVLEIRSSVCHALVAELSGYTNCYGLLVIQNEAKTQLVVFSSEDSAVDCRELFKYIVADTPVRGGGQIHLCQGGTNAALSPEIWLNRLKTDYNA